MLHLLCGLRGSLLLPFSHSITLLITKIAPVIFSEVALIVLFLQSFWEFFNIVLALIFLSFRDLEVALKHACAV